MGFSGGANGKNICLPVREMQVQTLVQEDPREKEMQPTLVFLPGEPHGQRSLVGYGPQGCKESNTTEHVHIHNVKLGFDPISDTEFYLKKVLVDTSI